MEIETSPTYKLVLPRFRNQKQYIQELNTNTEKLVNELDKNQYVFHSQIKAVQLPSKPINIKLRKVQPSQSMKNFNKNIRQDSQNDYIGQKDYRNYLFQKSSLTWNNRFPFIVNVGNKKVQGFELSKETLTTLKQKQEISDTQHLDPMNSLFNLSIQSIKPPEIINSGLQLHEQEMIQKIKRNNKYSQQCLQKYVLFNQNAYIYKSQLQKSQLRSHALLQFQNLIIGNKVITVENALDIYPELKIIGKGNLEKILLMNGINESKQLEFRDFLNLGQSLNIKLQNEQSQNDFLLNFLMPYNEKEILYNQLISAFRNLCYRIDGFLMEKQQREIIDCIDENLYMVGIKENSSIQKKQLYEIIESHVFNPILLIDIIFLQNK